MIETEYNSIILTELEVDASLELDGLSEDEAQNIKVQETGGGEDPKGNVDSSDSTSLDSEDTSSTSTNDSSSSSDRVL